MRPTKLRTFVLLAGACVISFCSVNADLVGWWAFDGDLVDSSPEGNDGVELDTAVFEGLSPGAIGSGKSIRFNGTSDGVQIEPSDSLDAEEFTLAYFINPDGATQNGPFERLTSRGGDSFETALSGSDELSYFSPSASWNTTGIFVENGEWTHVAWRNDGTEMRLLVNGSEEYVGNGFSEFPSGLLNMGVRHNGVEGYEGLMDDVLLWDDSSNPLTDEDIALIAESGVAVFLGGDGPTDTDEDGITDSIEDSHACLDKNTPDADQDPDGDGLTNAAEIKARTNPCAADSDGDTLGDKAELERKVGAAAAPTNPNKKDTDGDGLDDNVENGTGVFVSATDTGSDPLRADSDDDGLTDGQEATEVGTNPNKEDTDGDGFSDGREVAAQSDPKDPAIVPTIRLVGWWPLDGDLEDHSDNGNDGTAIVEATFEDSAPDASGAGKSIRFDGGADGVTIGEGDGLNTNPFTFAYYVNPEDAVQNGGFERLTSRGSDSFETALSGSNELSFFAPGIGWNGTGAIIEANEWTHVAWRTDGDKMDLFVNGEAAFTDGPAVPPEQPVGLMNLGIRHDNSEGYEGLMSDVALWSGALPDEDIQFLAENGVAVFVGGAGPGAFEVTSILYDSAESTATITWNSRAGRIYAVDFSEDLLEWLELDDALTSGGATTNYTTPELPPDKYLRVREF